MARVTRGIALVFLAAMTAAGCAAGTVTTESSGSWGAEAQEWIAAHDASHDARDLTDARFYAADAVSDSRSLEDTAYAHGRLPIVGLHSSLAYDEFVRGPLYVDVDGAARTQLVTWDDTKPAAEAFLAVLRIGSEGIERYVQLPGTWARYFGVEHQDAAAEAHDIAADYVDAWTSADPERFALLYAPSAAVTDSLVGQSLASRDDIIRASANSDRDLVLQSTRDAFPEFVLMTGEEELVVDVPLAFFSMQPNAWGRLAEVWLFVRTSTGCPQRMLVGLSIDSNGQVDDERRLSHLADTRACADASTLSDGWWTERDLPLPFEERVTASVETDVGVIETRNAPSGAAVLITWALSRFAEAGLPAPEVSTIVFNPFDDRCANARGFADWGSWTTQILVCFDSLATGPVHRQEQDDPLGEPPDPSTVDFTSRQSLVHELAHAWIVSHVDPSTREAFMQAVGVQTWNDRSIRWEERGVEWASETLVWGLLGRPNERLTLDSPPCEVLDSGFRMLTRMPPLTPCEP